MSSPEGSVMEEEDEEGGRGEADTEEGAREAFRKMRHIVTHQGEWRALQEKKIRHYVGS